MSDDASGGTNEMAKLAQGLPSKAAKIRALAAAGYARADIARFLGVRYQHVRNVLVQQPPMAGEAEHEAAQGFAEEAAGPPSLRGAPPAGFSRTPPAGLSTEAFRGNLTAEADGGIVIPGGMLAGAGIAPGETVLVRVADGEIRLSGYRSTLERLNRIAGRFRRPGVSEVDDFIAERRAAGARGD